MDSAFKQIESIANCDQLFEFSYEFFRGQGFEALVYVAPEGAAGPYVIREKGMATEWMTYYHSNGLQHHDPLPGIAFRTGKAIRLKEALSSLPSLKKQEQTFIDQFKMSSGIKDGFLIPAYGPFGRPGLIGLVNPIVPQVMDAIDVALITAIAQHIHVRMEQIQTTAPCPRLSPREREIVSWLVKGKSVSDIATILDLKVPTIATHLQRIYAKMGVSDRVSCVAKALARHYA